ncbi:hypothetical protein P171DRAFT_160225 [Karstenula rhodostoma CBS 690.94]|uniref:Uncharacterized protein n=1 Tax=Karstenula rhodostoma CBS 690.94 TaxID=1392251 RepID=A0A9P4P8F8_9PLEO|nr:hypothetical protein P171DRAFT_160225 [Karstenula rhodostoma CBS 690.94]
MHFSIPSIMAVAAILSTANALPHNRQGVSGAVGDSGSTNPFADWLSSLLGALPTEGAGSGSPGFGGGLPTQGAGGDASGGFGGFPTVTAQFPSGIFPSNPASVPTGGADGPSFELPGFSDAPTPTSVAGVFPSNSAVPTGGVTTPATTAPATLPTSAEGIDLSTVSFVFASSSAESPFGGFPGFGKKA